MVYDLFSPIHSNKFKAHKFFPINIIAFVQHYHSASKISNTIDNLKILETHIGNGRTTSHSDCKIQSRDKKF